MSVDLEKLDDLMHEKEVMEKWKGRFAEDELKEARQANMIEWYDLRKGPHYTEQQLVDYLETRKRAKCQGMIRPLNPEQGQPEESNPGGLKSQGNGSGKKRPAAISIVAGMSDRESAERFAAEALERSL